MSLINRQDRIFVAGHTGLVGSAITETLRNKGYKDIVTVAIDELNLLDQVKTNEFFAQTRPTVVFLAAAKVGGIHANNVYRADFIYENLQIQNNVIWSAHKNDVHRLVFLGSSCIYPRECHQPMGEDALLTGPLEVTNRPYALAKIAGLELVSSLRHQYQRDYFSVMPTNLYGPRDNYHPQNSHVLPALIRRFFEAQKRGDREVVVWGSGAPLREFMYSLDCADAVVHLAESMTSEALAASTIGRLGWSHINIGSGQEVSIKELATLVAEAVGFEGSLVFDPSKPDGTIRKLLDVSLLRSLGFESAVSLRDGLRRAVDWYARNYSDLGLHGT